MYSKSKLRILDHIEEEYERVSGKEEFKEQDEQIRLIFEAIKELITEKRKPKPQMGFRISDK